MGNIKETLAEATEIDGALGAALVDHESGMCLGDSGGGKLNLEVAAAGNSEVVRAKHRVMAALGISGGIDDILITLDDQLHIIRPVPNTSLFLYLALDRKRGNLAMARHQLKALESRLKV